MQYYQTVIGILEAYFHAPGWEKQFLNGGCYWLAKTLKRGIQDSVIMINRVQEHCALFFEGGLYDIRGKISLRNFRFASERDLQFMEKNYVPKFDAEKLDQYLRRMLKAA